MSARSWRAAGLLGGAWALAMLSGCVGVGYDGPVGYAGGYYDGDYYEPYGYDYGGWGGGRYRVGPPPDHGGHGGWGHAGGGGGGFRGGHPGGGRGAPSIPSHGRSH